MASLLIFFRLSRGRGRGGGGGGGGGGEKNPMLIAEITKNSFSITELDSKPGVFNRRMAQLTGKNCARLVSAPESKLEEIFPITQEWLIENVKFLTSKRS